VFGLSVDGSTGRAPVIGSRFVGVENRVFRRSHSR